MRTIFTLIGIIVVILVGAFVLYAGGASEIMYPLFGIVLGLIIFAPSGKKKEK